ncbi:hypothetical protein KIW84_010875 [Lathyrus oleraceus]|uniref:Uncharacterized protein n=1 Tax=Pisum sativum TaxID=3888 RepID=A0A9D4YM28_PEA|nr:hypothetical protein KIW84_010875 [Pisum sativum]
MKGETGKVTHGVTSVSCCNTLDQRRIELSENSSNKKILGVPIFDMPRSSLKKELSSITSPSVSIPTMSDAKAMESKHKIRMLDINLPCDANDLEFEKEGFTESVVNKTRSPTAEADSRNQIDLNFSMTEDEESYTTLPSSKTNMKAAIDLEAPAVPESKEDLAPEENKPSCTANLLKVENLSLLNKLLRKLLVMEFGFLSLARRISLPLMLLLLLFSSRTCNYFTTLKVTVILFKYPDYIDANLRLAATAKARNNILLSIEPVNDALKVNDKSPNALSMLVELELKNDEWENRNYFAAVRNEKRSPKLEATHLEKAKELYTRVMIQHSSNLYAANGVAVVFAEKGHFDVSKDIFTHGNFAFEDQEAFQFQ